MYSRMTRFVAIAACICLPSFLQAAPPEGKPEKPAKVLVAHLAEEIEEIDELTGDVTGTTYLYVVISVSDRSLSAHMGHGDAVDGGELIDGSVWTESFKGDKFEIFMAVEEPMVP